MEMRAQKSEPGSSLGLFGNTNQKGGWGIWGQVQEGVLGSSQPGRVPGQAACSGRCSGWSPAEDRNSDGSILPTLSLPANQPISPWNGGPSPPGQGPGPPPLQSSTSAGAPSLGRAWGVHAPGQVKKER